MKNFKLNPAAKEFQLDIDNINMSLMINEGWEFDHNPVALAQGISEEAAKKWNIENYGVSISMRTHDHGEYFFLSRLSGYYNNEEGDGTNEDSDMVLSDIISLLNQGLITIDESKDYTKDENGNYVPTFIEG